MTDKLEKFKFATIKNVSIKVEELENKVEIRIEPLDTSKEIQIYYNPLDHRDDLFLKDDHKKIEIDRSFMVGSCDDVDWDFETIYPCQDCNTLKERGEKERNKVENLEKLIEVLVDVIKEK